MLKNTHLVDIIIIGYNNPDLDSSCLKSVISNTTDWPYKITYFDNYNSGYSLTQIWNKLIKDSKCEYICLLNNDAFPTKTWLSKMMKFLLSIKSKGFVGPSTNNCHSIQSSINSEELIKNYLDITVILPAKKHLSGFCLLFPRVIWSKLNGFDERYTLYGQESDFINRAQKLGFNCWWRKDAFVYHNGETTIKKCNIDVNTEREKARKLFWHTK
jgi:GT2 family glycosyltransferase